VVSEAWTGEQGRGVPTVSHSLFSRTSTLSGVLRPAICSGCPIVRGRPPQIPIQQEGRPTAPPQGSVEVARRSLALRPAHSRRHQKNALHVSAGLKEATCIASRRRWPLANRYGVCHCDATALCSACRASRLFMGYRSGLGPNRSPSATPFTADCRDLVARQFQTHPQIGEVFPKPW